MTDAFDIAIVGAGIAGASLAAQVAARSDGRARVVLLEMEDQPGYHATGRSAAFWTESYGGPQVQPLTTASGPFLRDHGFLKPRGALTMARRGQERELDAFVQEFSELGVAVDLLNRAGLERHVPGLTPDWIGGALEPDCCDIDVAGLHQHWLGQAKQAGAQLWCRARLAVADHSRHGWALTLADRRTVRAGVLVNATGAWADPVAMLAGAKPLGITPLRRTMVQLRVAPSAPETLPLVLDIAGQFYFKSEAGKLWLSPHDEIPSPPCDAAAEELDVATAIDRLGRVVNWRIEQVEHKWAGLRSFAPDRLPVYGFDRTQPALFWCAGQGGFGIQTAPAAADLAARLLLGDSPGAVDPQPFLPGRFG